MKVLIVDDEAPARNRLRQILEEADGYTVVGDAANGKEALDAAGRLQPDIVLLDIRMPGIDGIETAHHLNELDSPPAIVFTTAYDQYAIDAFDAQAVGYVLKPVRRERLAKALKQAARISGPKLEAAAESQGLDTVRSHVCVNVHGEMKLIPVDEIVYFHADQKYTRICHADGQFLIDDSLKQLEREFGERFVRIHRNALVAVSEIDALHKTAEGDVMVRLRQVADDEGDALKVSRRHVASVRRRLKGAPT